MARSTNKKPASNVVTLAPRKPGLTSATVFHIEGDVKQTGDKTGKTRVSFASDLDFAGVDVADLYRMAAQSIVIKLAGNCRTNMGAKSNKDKAGKPIKSFAMIVKETIPARINVKDDIVSKLRSTSAKRNVDTMVSKVEKMSPEKQREMFEKLSAMMKAAKK